MSTHLANRDNLGEMALVVNDDEGGIHRDHLHAEARKVISPMSRSGLQNYFGQEQVVSLTNCQPDALNTHMNAPEDAYDQLEPA